MVKLWKLPCAGVDWPDNIKTSFKSPRFSIIVGICVFAFLPMSIPSGDFVLTREQEFLHRYVLAYPVSDPVSKFQCDYRESETPNVPCPPSQTFPQKAHCHVTEMLKKYLGVR